MSKKHITTLLLGLFIGVSSQAQRNYLMFDYSFSQFKPSTVSGNYAGIYEKLNRCEGNFSGASYHFAVGRKNYLGIGMGLSKVIYQKEWLGIFPESNQFGAAIVNGQIAYWSFPVSYTWTGSSVRRSFYRNCHSGRDWLHFGFSITYTPSFEGRSTFSVNTSGGADLKTFLSNFHSNEQSFQHSLTVGLCDQLFILKKRIRIDLEPYAGIGSGYFKEDGTSMTTISYGLRFRIGISAKLPHISIEKEVNAGNAEEKKKLLEQKQKEIQEQLNKTLNK
ncbi:MAG: hypothetical protein A3F72_08745 [Bacteroidetes bacterium RIFCSPLOWO2_12_FULL_35_15]|nr:MAG: hypothetical protein A3F72_08745 [Bacteroidetes bacterium RIFCSPLOWO2_12_FULL_35_15]